MAFFLGGHLHPAITRTCGRVSLCYIYCALRPNWSRRTSAAADAAALTRLKAAHSVKSMLACAPNTFPFFLVFCPTGKLKTPRALSDFFFFFFFFCFFGFFAWHLLNWAAAPPPIPPPSLILLFMQSLLHFTDHFSQRERERKKTKKKLLINFLSTANADRAGFWDGFRSAGTFEKWRESKRSVNTSLKSSCWSFFSFFFFFFCKLMYSNPPTLAWLTTPVSLNVLPVCSCCMSVCMYVSVDACSICSFVWILPL